MADRTLKVKCPTWDHVENFYSQKVKPGNLLSARVPFNPQRGTPITLSIELPNELVVAIDCAVREVKPAPDGKRSAVTLFLSGLSPELSGQLRQLVEQGRARRSPVRQSPVPPQVQSRTPSTELPVPLPMDAPIDELVEAPKPPKVTDVVARHRPVFIELDKRLRSLREAAAHEVLDVTWDASVAEIRNAYFDLIKRFHPDVFSRFRSPAISTLSQELFIYINKAYDRMRDAAVEAGHAIAAGPALIEHQGWFAGFDDFGTGVSSRPLRIQRPRSSSAPRPVAATASGPISVRFDKPLKRPTAKPQEEPNPPVPPEPREAPKPSTGSAKPPPIPPPIPDSRPATGLDAGSLFAEVEPMAESRAIDLGQRDEARDQQRVQGLGEQARDAILAEDFDRARDQLAAALELDPRRRDLRALYHVAYGLQLARDGKRVDARTQFEAALVHDRECKEALEAMDAMGADAKKGGLFRRFFR